MGAATLAGSTATLAPVCARAWPEDARRTQCPTERISEVSGMFSAEPNVIAPSPRVPEENRAGQASSHGTFWFP